MKRSSAPTGETKTLSLKHHRENFRFNLKHAKEHIAAARHNAEQLRKAGIKVSAPKLQLRVKA